jgi:hypothetical protein
MEIKKMPKNAVFVCIKCNFKCSKKSNYEKHITTIKHIHRHDGNKKEILEIKKNAVFSCKNCGKNYLTNSGFWKHSQKCLSDTSNKNIKNLTNVVLEIVKQNKELVEKNNETQKQNQDLINKLYEMCKNGTNNVIHTNSHNKSFNLHFFLNETCKNAMNITEFIDSLHLQIGDLERVGELGYVDGISNIIINKLNALDVTERPIHCTDKKRETMYVKDEDKWEKEDKQKIKMHRMVRKIANKNINLIPEFQDLHPEYKKISSNYSDQYNKIIIESMGGKGENDFDKEEKIIKKVAKEVFIDK